tara:strand:- start:1529 stop:2764 length:1236 start_codon:yes stop_codon:yes gene_type:complete
MYKQFLKNISVLVAGTSLAQSFTILASPVLSRLYTPEQFGQFGTFIVSVGLLSTIAALSYEMAIVKQSKSLKANQIFQICLFIAFSTSSAIFLLASMFGFLIEIPFANLVPIAMLLYAVNNAIYSLLNRYELYPLLAKAQILRSSSIVSLQVIFGYLSFTYYGLVLAAIVAALITCIYGYIQFIGIYKIGRFPSIKTTKILLTENIDFARYGVPQNLMSYVSANSPVFILSFYFGLAVVGSYFFAMKLVQIPANFFGAAIKRVFYRRAEVLKSDLELLLKLYIRMTSLMTIMIVPVMIFWFFNAEKIFPLIFGEGWDSAATISKWLLIWFGSQFVMAPTRSLFLVFDIQRNMLIFDTILGFLRFGLLIGLAENLEALEVVKYFAIVSAIISFSFVVGWYFFLVNKLKLIFN